MLPPYFIFSLQRRPHRPPTWSGTVTGASGTSYLIQTSCSVMYFTDLRTAAFTARSLSECFLLLLLHVSANYKDKLIVERKEEEVKSKCNNFL